jgi:hypothetical protein
VICFAVEAQGEHLKGDEAAPAPGVLRAGWCREQGKGKDTAAVKQHSLDTAASQQLFHAADVLHTNISASGWLVPMLQHFAGSRGLAVGRVFPLYVQWCFMAWLGLWQCTVLAVCDGL